MNFNSGDTAWILVASAMVLLMTPGLAFFYGGMVRGKNVLLSCLGQGCGAIAMSYAACLMDTWLGELHLDDLGRPYYLYNGKIVKRVSMFHDEYSWEVEDGAEEEIRCKSVNGIVKAGEILKLALPLAGEGKMSYEGSWKDVH